MSEHEFEAYLNLLARTLRLSDAQREQIAGELRDHLEARLDELTGQGVDRHDAILQALDEFGDANVLADDLARPRHQRTRRRLMQTSFATIAAAVIAVLVTSSLLPPRNPISAPIARAEPTQAPSKADESGFVYIAGDTQRPGAYSVPDGRSLSARQLLMSSGGNAIFEQPDDYHVRVQRIGSDGFDLVIDETGTELLTRPKPIWLTPNDTVHVALTQAARDRQRPDVAIFELTNIMLASNGLDHTRLYQASPSGLFAAENEFAAHVASVLIGLGYENDFASVTAWSGMMTIVGKDEAIQAAEQYLRQLELRLLERVKRIERSQPGPQNH